jgi:hypothetical protein
LIIKKRPKVGEIEKAIAFSVSVDRASGSIESFTSSTVFDLMSYILYENDFLSIKKGYAHNGA